MPRVHSVKKARKAYPIYGIEPGDPYYWWKFRYRPRIMSKTYPKRSQLTQSGFLSQLYDLEDGVTSDCTSDQLESLIAGLEVLGEECQESLDNMPEHLQESSSSGMLLQERIDALEGWVADLQGILDDDDNSDLDSIELAELVNDCNPGIGHGNAH